MPRRVAKSSRSRNSPSAGAVTVVAGSIRTADDPTALDVKISIWDTEVTMRADGSELGHWPASAVSVNPIDGFSFEFVAEGDRLVFTPNNPDEFKEHAIVTGSSNSKRKRRAKMADKAKTQEPVELRWDEDSKAEMEIRSRRSKAKPAKVRSQSRKERKIAARAAKERAAAASAQETAWAAAEAPQAKPPKPSRRERKELISPEPAGSAIAEKFEAAAATKPKREPRREPKPRKEPKTRKEPKPRVESNGHSRIAELRHRAWMSSLDFAREYDIFGLDRVPVHLEQRGDPNHSHTWNHRVAPASGPGTFICTVCGSFKKRTS